MQLEKTIKIIEKSVGTFLIEGRNITSRKVRALVDDSDIFVFKFNDSQVNLFETLPQKGNATVVISVTSPKEMIRADIIELKK